MHKSGRSLLSFVFMCLAALVLAAGCGDSGSNSTYYNPGGGGSSSGGTSKFATVEFLFPDLASAEAKLLKSVPDGTHFISFYGSNSKGDVLYGPVEYKAANKVTLPDVPVTTNIFFLQFRDSKHEILNLYATDKFVLKGGETTSVTVDDYESKEHGPKSMAVTTETASIAAGYATQCEAKITYGNGAVEVATELVDWTSSAASVATVNNSDVKGLATGVAPGSADITAEIADLDGSVAVTVTDAVVEALEITTPDPYVLMYATYQFKAQATFSDGTTKDVTKEVTWSSDNTEIAEIDETGLAIAVKDGQANITATADDGATDTTTFNISDVADVRSITISRIDNDSESIPLGFAASYKAVAKVSSAQKEYDVTDQVKWNSENADTGAFSDATPGLYDTMGCATGDTVISCVLEENGVESDNTLNLAVTDAKVTGIKLYGVLDDGDAENPYILSNRENIQFIAKADLSDGSEPIVIEPSADLTWTVDPADAAIDVNGLVTPAEEGAQFKPQQYAVKATYNYTYEPTGESETLEAETTLNVADALQVNEVTVEAVEPAGATEVPVGHTVKYKATAKISTMDLTFDVTDQITWSDVSAVGTMDAGLFTAETAGGPVDVIATLTLADIGGTEHEVASEAAQITVTDAILESIAIDQNAPQIINNNDEFVFTATATYSDGSTVTLDPASLPAGATMTWASADTSIAEIDETGAVTPKADTFGQTEITVTYTEGDVTADDSAMLSTYDSMAVTEVTIDTIPAGVTECANGYTVQFQAAAKIGTKDMEIDVTRQVEWNNDEIAAIGSIDENGVFTATATGDADIKATLTLADYGDVEKTLESDPITFTVTDAVLKSIVITSTDGVTDFGEDAPQILNNNMDLVFTATGVFSDGTEQILSSADGLAWESSVRTIAAIAADSGAVTPDTTAWGQTEITAAATNSEGEEISASTMLSTADAMSVTALELTVDDDLTTCAKGYTAQFRVTATVGTEGMTYDVTGQSVFENVDAIGEIDGHGLFTGTTVGTASIKATYTATDYSGTEINTESNAIDFEVTDAVLKSITITSNNFGEDAPQIVNTDDSLVFTAVGHFSYGDDQELTDVTWASSDESVAAIEDDGAVMPMADTFGQTNITATATNSEGETIEGKITLSTYDAMSVTALELTVDNDLTTCAQGYTAQFRAIATMGTTGMTFDVTDQVTFDGVDAIGEIDNHGLFTGTTVGSSTVTASYTATNLAGDSITVDSNEVDFEVTDAVLKSITITSNNFGERAPQIVNTDDSLVFMATGHFSDGSEQELTDVTWTSSDESVATIDDDGAVMPMADTFGQTNITASATNSEGETIEGKITLSTYDAMSVTALEITVDDNLASVANGYTAQFRAVATMGTNGMTFDVTNLVTFDGYQSMGDIDGHGLFTATTVGGPSAITATYEATNLAGETISVDSNEVEFEVTDAVLEEIVITSSDGMTDFGEDAPQILNDNMSLTFNATGRFSDGNELELNDVTWDSSDTGIADIDGSTGVVTPVTTAWGQTRITVTSADGTVTNDIMLSTADAMAVTNLEIAVDGDLTQIANGMTAQFRVYATIGTAAETYEVTDQVTWEGITGLGDIDGHGLFTSTTVGATNVTATYREITSDPYDFEVIDAVVESIEITPDNPMILNADTQQFTAKAILSDGTEIDPLDSADVAWSSSDEAICTIDDDGLATPVADQWGQVTITATYTDPATSETYDAETTLSISYQATPVAVRMIAAYVPDTLSDDSVDCELTANISFTIPGETGEIKVNDIQVAQDPSNPEQMTFNFYALGDEPVIKSVTLYNKATGGEETGERYAFAWFNSQDGIATIPDGETVLNETANTFAGGEGTESAPYLVANPRQLNNVNDYMESFFLQIRDVDFEGSTGLKVDRYEEDGPIPGEPLPVIVKSTAFAPFYNDGAGWRPIGMDSKTDFTGTYNGGGFEIKNLILNITTPEAAVVRSNRVNCGLFAMLKSAALENLKLSESCCFYVNETLNISIREELGGFTGSASSSALTDLSNAAHIVNISKNPHAGGIVAHLDAISSDLPNSMLRCCNSGVIASNSSDETTDAGGLIGYAQGRVIVNECCNSGDVFAYDARAAIKIGGIAGAFNESSIFNSWNTGNIEFSKDDNSDGDNNSAGGIAGCSNHSQHVTVSNCWSTGAITAVGTGSYRIGGIVGYDYHDQVTVTNCFYLTQGEISHGIGNITPDIETRTKGLNLSELKNQSEITVSGGNEGYINDLLNVADAVWSVNTKEDNVIAEGVLKGFSVFPWQL